MEDAYSRPDPGQLLMRAAYLWAERSTCDRLHVGAVIARDNRIVATGYNGAPSKVAHCDHRGEDADTACRRAVHAEANAIAFAARHGIAVEGSTIYTTHMPCSSCAQLIINAGVEKIFYHREYESANGSGYRLLREALLNVQKFQLVPMLRAEDLMDGN